MFSILDLQHRSEKAEEPPAEQIVEQPVEAAEEPQEFEFVLGRPQVASLLFVATVILMICVAASYLAGKSISAKTAAAFPVAAPNEPEPPPIVLNQEAIPVVEAPLFAEPKNGMVYIQMGAVEKGVAVIFAEGLRKRGLESFVAPGPSEKIFRVLIGPLPDPAAYVKAKATVDQIGLSTFARRFPN
jgi:cell division septation protein DedD